MPVQDLALWFFPDDTQNDTSCTNITILHDLLTETTQNFFVFIYSNDSSVKLVPPTNATIFIADIDCELFYMQFYFKDPFAIIHSY